MRVDVMTDDGTAASSSSSSVASSSLVGSALSYRFTVSDGSSPHASDYGIALAEMCGLPPRVISTARAIRDHLAARVNAMEQGRASARARAMLGGRSRDAPRPPTALSLSAAGRVAAGETTRVQPGDGGTEGADDSDDDDDGIGSWFAGPTAPIMALPRSRLLTDLWLRLAPLLPAAAAVEAGPGAAASVDADAVAEALEQAVLEFRPQLRAIGLADGAAVDSVVVMLNKKMQDLQTQEVETGRSRREQNRPSFTGSLALGRDRGKSSGDPLRGNDENGAASAPSSTTSISRNDAGAVRREIQAGAMAPSPAMGSGDDTADFLGRGRVSEVELDEEGAGSGIPGGISDGDLDSSTSAVVAATPEPKQRAGGDAARRLLGSAFSGSSGSSDSEGAFARYTFGSPGSDGNSELFGLGGDDDGDDDGLGGLLGLSRGPYRGPPRPPTTASSGSAMAGALSSLLLSASGSDSGANGQRSGAPATPLGNTGPTSLTLPAPLTPTDVFPAGVSEDQSTPAGPASKRVRLNVSDAYGEERGVALVVTPGSHETTKGLTRLPSPTSVVETLDVPTSSSVNAASTAAAAPLQPAPRADWEEALDGLI